MKNINTLINTNAQRVQSCILTLSHLINKRFMITLKKKTSTWFSFIYKLYTKQKSNILQLYTALQKGSNNLCNTFFYFGVIKKLIKPLLQFCPLLGTKFQFSSYKIKCKKIGLCLLRWPTISLFFYSMSCSSNKDCQDTYTLYFA